MKIGIHYNENSFADRWIAYCEAENIPFKIVNCYDSNIINQLKDCDALMWHHNHMIINDLITAKRILFALQHAGIKVFPDFNTGWHFDDKVAQKYLLEAIGAPYVPSYVFYDKQKAIDWVHEVSFPKVFKLKGGSGSSNVKLIRNQKHALKIVNKAFTRGFSNYNRFGSLKERYRKYRIGKGTLFNVLKGLGRVFVQPNFAGKFGKEKGYAYFQDFMPKNDYDIRVIIIGNRAFAVKRLVRENDFRASGSGEIKYCKNEINIECIKIAFDVNQRINSQSIGFDFVFDENNKPFIVEISYGFAVEFYDPCPGYWDENLMWQQGKFNPQVWMIEDLIKHLKK